MRVSGFVQQTAGLHHEVVGSLLDRCPELIQRRNVCGMEQPSHDAEPSELRLQGYVHCRSTMCRNIVLEVVARRTCGLCDECIAAGLLPTFRDLSVMIGGQRHGIGARKRNDRGGRDKSQQRLARAAERRSLTRLKNLCPGLFDLILAEERAKEGLEPMTIERAISHSADDVEQWEQLLQEGTL